MSLGTPYNIGSTAAASGATSTVVTAGTDANSDSTTMPASGDSVFVLIGISSGTYTVSSVTDTHSNTYTQVTNGKFTPADSQACFVYECLNPGTKLTSGNTVTVNWSGTTAETSNVRVIGCSGVASSAADDQSGSASGSGTSVTVTAGGALAQASELVIAVCQSGNATGGVASWGTFTQMGHNLHSGTGSYFGCATLDTSTTTAPSASATITTTGAYGVLLLTFKASTSGAGSLAVSTSSPLPGGTVGTAYTEQLAASGGVPPYTWSKSSGSLPAGLTLSSGTPSGGGGGDVTYVGANCGPQGGPTVAQLTSTDADIGPIGYVKFFYSAGGTGIYTGYLGNDVNGGSGSGWSTGSGGSSYTPAAVTTALPGVFILVTWGVLMSAAAIASFVSSIPHTVAEVGFCFQQEPENAYAATAGTQFVADWTDQANKIRAAQASTPVKLTLVTAHYESPYQTGGSANAAILAGSFIPPNSVVDVYGLDFYDRSGYWAGPDMSTNTAWINWTKLVKGLSKPLAITEYGISNPPSAALQNSRLQADWAYIQGAFGTGGTLSPYPLYAWLYWNTDGTALTTGTSWGQMESTAMQAQWATIAGNAGGSGTTGTGNGGVISGTPTTTGTSTPTIEVTDSAGTNATAVLSITISAGGTLTVTSTGLPDATESFAYSTQLAASGGVLPYTWSLSSGSLPAGLSISGQQISGTPTATGTSSFVLEVTDAASSTATASVSIAVDSTLTVTTASLPPGQAGVAYAFTLAAVDGVSPYTWQIASGSLPPGLALDPDGSLTGTAGQISGTPTTQGTYPLSFTVTGSAGSTATSGVMTLTIAVSSGGLPTLGRLVFGGGLADFGFQFSGSAMDKAAAVTYSFWDAASTGTQYIDLEDMSNAPLSGGLVTSDSNGFLPEFQGPAAILEMYADPSGAAGTGPRYRITTQNLGDYFTALYAAVAGLAG